MTAHSSNLAGVLSAARGRLMAVRVGPSVLWWITAAALAAACAALLLRWMGFATWWLAAWPAVGALVALVRGWASRMTLLDAAVAVDHTHGFKDTLSTAWSADRGALVDEAFAALHREQTGQCLRRIDLSRLGGMPAGSTIAASIGSIVLLAVALALPWPAARDGLAVRESSERIAAREREQSERDFTETAPVDELPQLADRIEQLAQDGDLAEAEKAVEELERRMEELARRRRERSASDPSADLDRREREALLDGASRLGEAAEALAADSVALRGDDARDDLATGDLPSADPEALARRAEGAPETTDAGATTNPGPPTTAGEAPKPSDSRRPAEPEATNARVDGKEMEKPTPPKDATAADRPADPPRLQDADRARDSKGAESPTSDSTNRRDGGTTPAPEKPEASEANDSSSGREKGETPERHDPASARDSRDSASKGERRDSTGNEPNGEPQRSRGTRDQQGAPGERGASTRDPRNERETTAKRDQPGEREASARDTRGERETTTKGDQPGEREATPASGPRESARREGSETREGREQQKSGDRADRANQTEQREVRERDPAKAPDSREMMEREPSDGECDGGAASDDDASSRRSPREPRSEGERREELRRRLEELSRELGDQASRAGDRAEDRGAPSPEHNGADRRDRSPMAASESDGPSTAEGATRAARPDGRPGQSRIAGTGDGAAVDGVTDGGRNTPRTIYEVDATGAGAPPTGELEGFAPRDAAAPALDGTKVPMPTGRGATGTRSPTIDPSVAPRFRPLLERYFERVRSAPSAPVDRSPGTGP